MYVNLRRMVSFFTFFLNRGGDELVFSDSIHYVLWLASTLLLFIHRQQTEPIFAEIYWGLALSSLAFPPRGFRFYIPHLGPPILFVLTRTQYKRTGY